MSTSLILIIISVVLFVLAALGVDVNGINMTAWGLVFFAAGHLPSRSL